MTYLPIVDDQVRTVWKRDLVLVRPDQWRGLLGVPSGSLGSLGRPRVPSVVLATEIARTHIEGRCHVVGG